MDLLDAIAESRAVRSQESYDVYITKDGASYTPPPPPPSFKYQLSRGIIGGLRDTAQGAIDIRNEVASILEPFAEAIPTEARDAIITSLMGFTTPRADDSVQEVPGLPEVDAPDAGVAEGLLRGLVQFGAGAAAAPIKGAGMVAQMGRGAVADALFDPEDGNLSTMLKEFGLEGAVLDFLDSQVDGDAGAEERLQARVMQSLEGAGLGALVDGAMAGFRAIRSDEGLVETVRQSLAETGAKAKAAFDAIPVDSNTMYSNPVGVVADAVGSVMEQTDAGLISTRLPTAVKSTEDPLAENLTIGLAETKADTKLYEHNVNITKDYPNMRAAPGATTDETAEQFIEHAKENLLYLHDQVPEQTRPRSQMWYDGARAVTDRWVKEYGIPDTSIAGVLAALSPQKDWYQNAALAEKTISIATQQKDTRATNEMIDLFYGLKDGKGKPVFDKPQYRPMIEAMQGKTYAELTHENPTVERAMKALFVRLYDQTYNTPEYRILSPEGEFLDLARNADGTPSKAGWGSLNEIGKAIGAIEANGDVNIISPLMGERHKVRNFYNNIYAPNSKLGEVTIDTHAVAAALLRPLSGNSLEVDHNFKNQSIAGRGTTKGSSVSGVNGNYGLYAEAYRRAAAERGILPRQMQSITWEAVRGLFTDTFKSNANNVAEIDAIWQKYKSGEIELDETRRQVNDRAGGINPPTWQ